MNAMQASKIVVDSIDLIRQRTVEYPVLDLACGNGRNGMYLVNENIPVVFADRDQDRLDELAEALSGSTLADVWTVDFEAPGQSPLADEAFSAILAFRYLHRPLMPAIKNAIKPGGLVVYETFTTEHPRYGRPTNPDYLLRPGELEAVFSGWQILHSFEGESRSETGGRPQAIAQIIAEKPLA